MEKRIIARYLIIAVVIGVLGTLIYNIHLHLKKDTIIQENIRELPSFEFYTLNKQRFLKEDIDTGKPLLLIFFSTDCSFCQFELKQVTDYISQLADKTVLLVSPDSITTLVHFTEKMEFDAFPMITVLKCEVKTFQETFGKVPVPTTFLYNKNHELVRQFRGSTKMETVLSALKNQPMHETGD